MSEVQALPPGWGGPHKRKPRYRGANRCDAATPDEAWECWRLMGGSTYEERAQAKLEEVLLLLMKERARADKAEAELAAERAPRRDDRPACKTGPKCNCYAGGGIGCAAPGCEGG